MIAATGLPAPDSSLFQISDPVSTRLHAAATSKSLSRLPQAAPDVAAASVSATRSDGAAPNMIPGSYPIPPTTLTP